jgi:hypothetical protein
MVKKNVDKEGLNERAKKDLEEAPKEVLAHASGIGGDPILEPIPKYIRANNENVYQGQNNTWIIFGRDRPASRLSGYGGIGDTQCGSIDIVVGRMAAKPKSDIYVDPDFRKDAARIHISQKTDIDANFTLAEGKVGPSSAKSGIGIKADAIRIVAREGIKLVTGTDAENSQGGTVDSTLGIDIIAGNDQSELQPIPKGENLSAALDKLVKNVENLSGIVSAFLQSQMKFNSTAGTHFHTSPFYGSPTTPSTELSSMATETQMNQMQDCVVGLQKFKSNLVSFKNTYLRSSGKKYINSRYNSVN